MKATQPTAAIQAVIAKEIKAFDIESKALLIKTVQRHKASGELASSLNQVLVHFTEDFQLELSAYFKDQGRIIEQKAAFAYKAPAKALAEWIRRIGLNRFSYTPSGGTIKEKATRIAFAIKNSEQNLRFGALGGTTSGIQLGIKNAPRTRSGKLKRVVRSEKISWFYKPYYALWGQYRRRIFNAYFDSLDDALVDVIQLELNKIQNNRKP